MLIFVLKHDDPMVSTDIQQNLGLSQNPPAGVPSVSVPTGFSRHSHQLQLRLYKKKRQNKLRTALECIPSRAITIIIYNYIEVHLGYFADCARNISGFYSSQTVRESCTITRFRRLSRVRFFHSTRAPLIDRQYRLTIRQHPNRANDDTR